MERWLSYLRLSYLKEAYIQRTKESGRKTLMKELVNAVVRVKKNYVRWIPTFLKGRTVIIERCQVMNGRDFCLVTVLPDDDCLVGDACVLTYPYWIEANALEYEC